MTSVQARPFSRIGALLGAGGALCALLAGTRVAHAAVTFYVSPTGSPTAACTRPDPCDLATGGTYALAGDVVVLLDGTYAKQSLNPVNSGTASAWITFQADAGAVPILDGGGGDVTASGVGSDTSVYVRYIGLVARNWASGFTNQWTGSTTEFTANGNWQYINCIGDGNTRNGFAFNSAKGVTIRECIAAHNGTSATSSWSSATSRSRTWTTRSTPTAAASSSTRWSPASRSSTTSRS